MAIAEHSINFIINVKSGVFHTEIAMTDKKTSRKVTAILPLDVVADILSRVPVKSLVRFKCVCKSWFSLISDPQFAKIQLKRAKSDNRSNLRRVFLTTSPLQSIDYEAFSDGNNNSNVSLQLGYPLGKIPEYDAEIAGSCNGLLCVNFDYNQMVLWNPTTRVSRELPGSDPSPDQGTFFYGLGYDISFDDYKVIRGVISSAKNVSRENEVQVFSLKNNSWKKVVYFHSSTNIHGSGIVSNNALHWLGTQESDSGKYASLSFDLTEERFEEVVPIPKHFNQDIYTANLGILGDNIILFCDRSGICFEVWEMKEYGVKDSWSKLFSVSSGIFSGYEYFPTLIGLTKDGKLLLEVDGRELVLYSTKEGTSRNFLINDEWDQFGAVIYEESLVSPNDDEATKSNQTEDTERNEDYS